MTTRSIMTIAAILTTTAAGCQHQHASLAGDSGSTLGEPSPRSSLARTRSAPPITKTEEHYKDGNGFELVLSSDGKGKVSARVIDPQGASHNAKEYQLENRARLCLPAPKATSPGASDSANSNCQLLNFVSDGSFIKLEKASCMCYLCGGIAYCYGSTCP